MVRILKKASAHKNVKKKKKEFASEGQMKVNNASNSTVSVCGRGVTSGLLEY